MKVVISGSFRKHLQDINQALKNFNKSEVKVLAPQTAEVINNKGGFVFIATDDPKKSADVLEKEFMANIKRANFLYVANAGGYVGQSMATEMGVAIINNVPIIVAEEIKVFSDQISNKAQELIKKSVFWQLSINEINSEKIAKLKLVSFTPVNLSNKEMLLLKSLVKKLLENLKLVKINV